MRGRTAGPQMRPAQGCSPRLRQPAPAAGLQLRQVGERGDHLAVAGLRGDGWLWEGVGAEETSGQRSARAAVGGRRRGGASPSSSRWALPAAGRRPRRARGPSQSPAGATTPRRGLGAQGGLRRPRRLPWRLGSLVSRSVSVRACSGVLQGRAQDGRCSRFAEEERERVGRPRSARAASFARPWTPTGLASLHSFLLCAQPAHHTHTGSPPHCSTAQPLTHTASGLSRCPQLSSLPLSSPPWLQPRPAPSGRCWRSWSWGGSSCSRECMCRATAARRSFAAAAHRSTPSPRPLAARSTDSRPRQGHRGAAERLFGQRCQRSAPRGRQRRVLVAR